jgi:hypothetical protein
MVAGQQFGLGQIHRAQRDPDDQRDQHVRAIEQPRARPQHPAQPPDQADPVSGAVQQHRTRVPDHPRTRRLNFQSAVPSITLLHREGASLQLGLSDFAIRSSQVAGTFSPHSIRSRAQG